MKKWIYTLSFIGILAFISCERIVEFEIPSDEKKVVVEGSIETDGYPVVLLSSTVGFFDTIDISTYANAFLHDAVILVSNGEDTVQLKEYSISADGLDFYLYTVDTSDLLALNFKGEVGKRYELSINYEGQIYTSFTTIPENTMRIDSMWSKPPVNEDALAHNPNYRTVYAKYFDNPIKGEYVRIFNKINSQPYLAPFFSVSDDEIINGTSVEVLISKGRSKMNTEKDEGEPYPYYYQVGDTLSIKWCAIDRNSFEFYKTLEFSYSAVGNPFATPIVVTTNIAGGALGVWAGYNPIFSSYIVE